jgi:hypothetical protein
VAEHKGHLTTGIVAALFAATGALFNNVSSTLDHVVTKVDAISVSTAITGVIAQENKSQIDRIWSRLDGRLTTD